MPKWSIRNLWSKRTENETLKPEVRNLLLGLDGLYEPQSSRDARAADERAPEHDDAARRTALSG